MPSNTELPDPEPWDADWFNEALGLVTGNHPDTVDPGPAGRLTSSDRTDDRSVRVPKSVVQQDELWLDVRGSARLTEMPTEHLSMVADSLRSVEVDWVGHALMGAVADVLIGRITLSKGQDRIALLQRLSPGWMDRTPLVARINVILAERARLQS
ncbi:hypothetical protein GCM10009798_33580 [Nocardioides panacihumi]|uniref:Uncharacterized protein n=1 Tax=Nocardioides panacihumi TaxID=400774 RepID=A0ABN2RJS3_9ACTN